MRARLIKTIATHRASAAAAALALLLALLTTACATTDSDRIPPAPVRIDFQTVGDWTLYGVAGALDSRVFIRNQSLPVNYPYTDASATGYGGVLLVGSFTGEPAAYDLACPVEAKPSVRIAVVADEGMAECPQCHSTYDVFRTGAPLSGPAADKHYALRAYRESPPSSTFPYRRITP